MADGPWPHGDPRFVAKAILSDPRYHDREGEKLDPTGWDRLWAWIVERLHDLFGSIGHALGAANPLATLAGIAVMGAGAVALTYLVVRCVAWFGRSRGLAAPAAAERAAVERTAAELRIAALEAARGGRFRAAAALLFLAASRWLDERGRLPYDASRTPGEYRRAVGDPDFDVVAREAVVALFGAQEPRADLFERMRAAYERFTGSATA